MSGATLRHRSDGSVELRVNGVFVMDDVETSSERELARDVLARSAREILVGGLGLGFTVRDLLASTQVSRLVVAEIHAEIAGWMRAGTIDGADLLADDRLDLIIGDVRDVVGRQPAHGLDAILLDVDNGPDYLVHDDNAAIYRSDFVGICADRLRAGGTLSLWSQADSAPLRAALAKHFAEVTADCHPVRLQGRDENYWIVRGTGPKPGR